MPSYYHVTIIPKSGVDPKRIEKKFNLARDWFRFNPTSWVIYTNKDADTWASRLKEFVQPGGKLFICKLDVSDRQGWLPKAFWDWLRKRQASQSEAERQ
jgi:hypothetical protein